MSNYSYLRTTCATFVVAFCLAAPLAAQTDGEPTSIALTINDVVPATGFSADAVTDVLGLQIGMTVAELEAALASAGLPMLVDAQPIPDAPRHGPQRMGYVVRNGDVTPGFQWDDGFKATFEPVRASSGLTMYSEMADALGSLDTFINGQHLWVAFGGPSVGARVQEIRRSAELEEPVDKQTMIESITGKYGTPSWIDEVGNFWVEIYYYYDEGQLITRDHRSNIVLRQNCKPKFFTGSTPEILYTDATIDGWYGLNKDPRTSKQACDAGIFVRLMFGDVPNTIDRLDVAIMDNVARWENTNAIWAQAEGAHAEWLLSVAGSKTAPDL